jgi:hypothetical protein
MSIYDLYKTESQKEKEGVPIMFADEEIRITLARAGGGNTKYDRIIAANAKPYKRAIQSDLLSADKANELIARTFAEAVIVKWETKVDGEYKDGIELEGVGIQPATVKNITQVLTALPDLLEEIKTEATRMSNFRTAVREEDAKN